MAFDDLPKINKSHVQSAESVRAFEEIFCLPSFIARCQNPDYGKDYDIELCESSNALNIVFSVQLKSVEKLERIENGKTISFQIETSRLNYLSRTLCGALLVVYDLESKESFCEWVDELLLDLDVKKNKWRGQEFVSVHLKRDNVLNLESAKKIHIDVKQRYERISTSFVKDESSARIDVSEMGEFDIESKLNQNYTELMGSLFANGRKWISSGYYAKVLHLYSTIPSKEWQNSSSHLLNIAYAYEFSGMPLQALTYSNAALSFSSDLKLNKDEKVFAENIHATSRLNIGQLDSDAYYNELRQIINNYPSSEQIQQIELEVILRDVVFAYSKNGDHLLQIDNLVEQGKKILKSAEDRNKGSSELGTWILERMFAKIEFQAADQHIINSSFQIRIAEKMGFPVPLDKRVKLAAKAISLKKSAFDRIERLMKVANKFERADLLALCLIDSASHDISFLNISRGFLNREIEQKEPVLKYDSTRIQDCIKRIDIAISIYEKLEIGSRLLSAIRLKAEIMNSVGRVEDAEILLKSVRDKGLKLGINPDVFQLTPVPHVPNESESESTLAKASDVELMRFAKNVLEASALPASRIENVYKDFVAMRLCEVERAKWCKHVQILQNLMHTFNKETLYAIDPERYGKCQKFGYESQIGNKDPQVVISAFKSAYCSKCCARET